MAYPPRRQSPEPPQYRGRPQPRRSYDLPYESPSTAPFANLPYSEYGRDRDVQRQQQQPPNRTMYRSNPNNSNHASVPFSGSAPRFEQDYRPRSPPAPPSQPSNYSRRPADYRQNADFRPARENNERDFGERQWGVENGPAHKRPRLNV